jgi:hypothetical protein
MEVQRDDSYLALIEPSHDAPESRHIAHCERRRLLTLELPMVFNLDVTACSVVFQ